MPVLLGWTTVLAGGLAVFATYWDEAWHTDVGRDTFWSAPHLLLYGSVAAAGFAVVAWGLRALVATRSFGTVLSHGPLRLAGLAGATVLVAAPVDAAWHAAYGRDAVLWSPPHMLAVFGSTALLLAVLAGLPRDAAALRAGTGVLLLANGVAVVFEYEADVPQFSEVLYLPVLLVVGLYVVSLIRIHVPLAAPVAVVAGGYALLRVATSVGLATLDRSTPDLPIAVLGFAAYDLPLRSNLQRMAAAGGTVAALAWAAAAADVTSPDPGAVALIALPAIITSALVVLVGIGRPARIVGAAAVLVAAAAAMLVPARPAAAHDPGQGRPVAEVEVMATTDTTGDIVLAVVATRDHCDDLVPVRVVARRAGKTITGNLRAVGDCRYAGALHVAPRGRWFLYAELLHDGKPVEAWLPVFPADTETVSATRTLYAPAGVGEDVTVGQMVSGGAIYAVGLALFGFGVSATRTTRPTGRLRPRS